MQHRAVPHLHSLHVVLGTGAVGDALSYCSLDKLKPAGLTEVLEQSQL